MDNSCIIIVQARMGSKRLPQKTLMEFAGSTTLGHLLDALHQKFQKNKIWVATSNEQESSEIVEFCARAGISCYAGSENNVASRFAEILKITSASCFFRVCADSPLFDTYPIDEIWRRFLDASIDNFDLVTTTAGNRPFPSGMNAELMQTKAFLNGYSRFSSSEHFEHVTKYFYEHQNQYRILSIDCPVSRANRFKFSLDTLEDLVRIKGLFALMDRPHYFYDLKQKCDFYERLSLNHEEA